MEKELIIKNCIEYVKLFFSDDFTGHDFFHTMRVYTTSLKLWNNEGGDLFIISLASLLHDVDDYKISKESYLSKSNARGFMKNYDIDEDIIEIVCKIIDDVSFKGTDSVIPDTIEGMIVQDADRLDAMGAIGIARCFAYGGSKGRSIYLPDETAGTDMDEVAYRNHEGCSLNHFHEKLLLLKDMMNTATGKKIAESRHEYMKQFVDEFMAEWNEIR